MSVVDFLCWVNIGRSLIPSKHCPDIDPTFLLVSPCQVPVDDFLCYMFLLSFSLLKYDFDRAQKTKGFEM